jgi:hypothetical protein
MQAFTKIEIKWVIDELEAEMKQLKSLSAVETGAARSLYILRAEQLDVISGKLLLRRKTKWHNVRESRLIAGTQN